MWLFFLRCKDNHGMPRYGKSQYRTERGYRGFWKPKCDYKKTGFVRYNINSGVCGVDQ